MKVLCLTDRQDRPETELFLRLANKASHLTIMCNPEGRHYHLLREAGIRTIPLRIKSRRDREATRAIRDELYAEDYDIAHAFNSRSLACLIRAAKHHRARVLGYRGVTTGVGYLKPDSWGTFLNPRLDGILCVSESVRQALVSTRFLWLRFPAHKAKTIYKGHDPAWYQQSPVPKQELGIPDDAKTICCIARNSSKKGAITLLHAFDRIPAHLNAHLILVGNIVNNKRVHAQASLSRRPERIHFTGYRPDAVAIIRGANLLVSPSESGEGLPRVVLEAMCVQTPVVATDAGGTRELVIHDETGFLVSPRRSDQMASAIENTLSDLTGSARRADAALRHVAAHFHPERTAAETNAWYRQILERDPNGSERAPTV